MKPNIVESLGFLGWADEDEVGARASGVHTQRGDAGVQVINLVSPATATLGFLLVLLSILARVFGALKAGGWYPFVVWGYAKIAKDEVLEQKRRAEIMQLLELDSGLTASDVRKRLDYGWGTTIHHLETLRRNGFVVTVQQGRRRHYFPQGGNPKARVLKVLGKNHNYDAVMRVLAKRPGLTAQELAEDLPQTRTSVGRTANRLVEAGLLERRRDGRKLRYYPPDTQPAG